LHFGIFGQRGTPLGFSLPEPAQQSPVSFIGIRKTFHLSFSKNLRRETRMLVKRQQFIICMNEMMDDEKSFSAELTPLFSASFAG
jgi:hypothetical protein